MIKSHPIVHTELYTAGGIIYMNKYLHLIIVLSLFIVVNITVACAQPSTPSDSQSSSASAPSSETTPTQEPSTENLPSKVLKVSGTAMEPTLHDGDRVLVFSIHRELKRGDIVICTFPNNPDIRMIKRIIGLPGETIEIKDGQVLVNGTALNEPYIKEPPEYSLGPDIISENHYFILGDNRNHSSDSHNSGLVPLENILAIVQFK
jgi:signal peptidase I